MKKSMLICLLLLLSCIGVCSATIKITRNDWAIAIGDIRTGMSIDDVIALYGPPEKVDGYKYYWTTSPNIELTVYRGIAVFGNGNVIEVSVKPVLLSEDFVNHEEKNMLSTGVYLGMPLEELVEVYGLSVQEFENDPEKRPHPYNKDEYIQSLYIHNCDDAQRIYIGLSGNIVDWISIRAKPLLGW